MLVKTPITFSYCDESYKTDLNRHKKDCPIHFEKTTCLRISKPGFQKGEILQISQNNEIPLDLTNRIRLVTGSGRRSSQNNAVLICFASKI